MDSSLQPVDALVCLDRNTSAVRQLVIWGKSGQKAVRINVEDIQGISLQAEGIHLCLFVLTITQIQCTKKMFFDLGSYSRYTNFFEHK